MINLQRNLSDLASQASGSPSSNVVLEYSITTERPYMELWAHHTFLNSGRRMYNMNILAIAHADIFQTVVEFLILLENVMIWARNDF